MRRAGSGGFTLLEMMVVLAIVALAMALVVPAVTRGMTTSVDDVARDISVAMRKARTSALSAQRSAVLWIDLDRRTYAVGSDKAKEIPGDISIRAQVASMDTKARRAGFRFFPDGSATGGRLLLAQGDASTAIEVDWLSGRVSIREREAGR